MTRLTIACAVGLAMEARGLPAQGNHDWCPGHIVDIGTNARRVMRSAPCSCCCHGEVGL